MLPGPWDAASAQIFADAGFEALATPSHGVSASLGNADGETPAGEMFAAVARIVRAVDVPVTADIERGLRAAPEADRRAAAGVRRRRLQPGGLARAARWSIRGARRTSSPRSTQAAGGQLLLNARVDSYLRGSADSLADALERGAALCRGGRGVRLSDGAPLGDIGVLARELRVPVNAWSPVGGPDAARTGRGGRRPHDLRRRAGSALRGPR